MTKEFNAQIIDNSDYTYTKQVNVLYDEKLLLCISNGQNTIITKYFCNY
jgi:hypothetical protein